MGLVLLNGAVVAACMLALWLVSVAVRDASIVDIAWGPLFVVIAWRSWFATATPGIAQTLVAALVSVWGLRLGLHLARRNLGHGEDRRYAAMRAKHPHHFAAWSLVFVFALQGVVALVVSLPVQFAMHAHVSSPSIVVVAIGVVAWSIGVLFESVGDWQLTRFKRDPANASAVMDRGLWRYTRHPNYFGDFLAWWGTFVVCVACGAPWWTIVGPIAMSYLLMRVSGVPMLERGMEARRPGYRDYIARTSAFFPRPPRSTR